MSVASKEKLDLLEREVDLASEECEGLPGPQDLQDLEVVKGTLGSQDYRVLLVTSVRMETGVQSVSMAQWESKGPWGQREPQARGES